MGRQIRQRSNRFEAEVIQHCLGLGGRILTRGWPDLLMQTPDGLVAGVEIKSRTDRLNTEQASMHEMLEMAGLPVFVIHEDKSRKPTAPRQTRIEQNIYRSISGRVEIRMRTADGRLITELQENLESARQRRAEILAERVLAAGLET